ncbi:MAG: transcriptional repressor [Cyclobacteriaceae bacterium]|jgi:Fur family ferric uptake transcriptional regulator|nr:transcriptional repressor [Cyclobacteriaceae bacterium]
MNGSLQLLKDFRLRSTPGRVSILNIFLKRNHALGHADIEKNTPAQFDRVTIYRTLKTFLDKGLIHKVLDDEGGLKYALCTEACSSTHHHHDHVHFKCSRCGQTSCLSIDVPAIKLPKGYKPTEFNLLIQGICAHCAAR